MTHLPISPDPATIVSDQLTPRAHAVRPATEAAGDDIFAALRHALAHTTLRGFDLGTAAIIDGGRIEGRVWVRAAIPACAGNGRAALDSGLEWQTFTLTVLDAATFALILRCDAMRGAALFADAFAAAAVRAEQRVAAIHAWSGQIRPTEDVE